MENELENNIVKIGGRIASKPEFSHEIYDEKFYKFNIETNRLSSYSDRLPVLISERIIQLDNLNVGDLVYISGQFRSYNEPTDNGKSKLVLTIFTKEIDIIDDESIITLNDATFIGYVCKPPIYRKTPLGREITDLLIAVNRTYKKSDYIPCILWGRNAKFCENICTGTMVKLSGRIQSRKYEKKQLDGSILEKVAYELSVSKFSVLDEKENNEKNEEVEQ